jgi:hypothetical protein
MPTDIESSCASSIYGTYYTVPYFLTRSFIATHTFMRSTGKYNRTTIMTRQELTEMKQSYQHLISTATFQAKFCAQEALSSSRLVPNIQLQNQV